MHFYSWGTFSFWSAFLANGDVIAAEGYTKWNKDVVKYRKELPQWELMPDPCFEDQRPKPACLGKGVQYGFEYL